MAAEPPRDPGEQTALPGAAPVRPSGRRRPASSYEGWIAVGQVMGAFGAAGFLKVKPFGRFPDRFSTLRRVFIGEDHREAPVLFQKPHGEGLVVRLGGVSTRDAARDLFGQYLYVPESEAVELPAGEFFIHQVIGLQVVTTDGETLGTVREVLETGSNDVYVVRAGAKEVLVPAIKEVIKRIDPTEGVIEVTVIPGLLD